MIRDLISTFFKDFRFNIVSFSSLPIAFQIVFIGLIGFFVVLLIKYLVRRFI